MADLTSKSSRMENIFQKNEINPERIAELCNAFGPSGFEEPVRRVIQKQGADFLQFRKDSIGNLFAGIKPGLEDKKQNRTSQQLPLILMDAHMDEVGLMIQSIEENGTCNVLGLGGINQDSLSGSLWQIQTGLKDLKAAVMSTVPVHYRTRNAETPQSRLDPGSESLKSTENMGIVPGCPAAPFPVFEADESTGWIMAKALDDRIGCFCQLELWRRLSGSIERETGISASALNQLVQGIFTVQEEVGERGMKTAVHRLRPAAAICFEGCPADDTFTSDPKIQSGLGKGVMVRALDRSVITNSGYLDAVTALARRHSIPFQIAVRSGGGTNAQILTEYDIPAIVLGVPVRYAHSPYGWCDCRDVKAAIDLAEQTVLSMIRSVLKTEQNRICPVHDEPDWDKVISSFWMEEYMQLRQSDPEAES